MKSVILEFLYKVIDGPPRCFMLTRSPLEVCTPVMVDRHVSISFPVASYSLYTLHA